MNNAKAGEDDVRPFVDRPSVVEGEARWQRDKSIEVNEALIIVTQPIDLYRLNRHVFKGGGRQGQCLGAGHEGGDVILTVCRQWMSHHPERLESGPLA
ncbi:hypothetical protein WH06_02670 [Aeromonas salmonicida subsp. salmonicida]|uniref:Uncharacterized protein n=1 Tax=Aeromonas salmonicida TaxID=645 RepID=A0AAX3VWB4_AERSA|nr:hypothetical protein [Aeromonas salmonicida]ASI22891.1 hypothetical protein CE456_09695 [Aeromonas salmonicida]ASI27206.1 hypothetical protein CE463_09725 [Aeromonas salmonicida]ASI31324.1 hypothetical protein CE462_08620 [Aeromonas salmonicida]ATD39622.1 hypothetical protein BHG40_18110 [Aeromonas salmonicida subsp. masoucida]AYO63869.1 hypothetical protein C5P03_14370 [Aeromonas salmonicida subsp. salmonicida 01-B526]